MIRTCALAGLGVFLAPRFGMANESSLVWSGLKPEDVERQMQALMEEFQVPGVSVALVRDGALDWAKGFGVLNAETDKPVTTGSIFQAASISKAVFSVAVMKLVEDQKLDLDKPLADYRDESWLPEEPETALVTARMVLQHTTGLPNWRRGKPLKFKFPPGSKFSYSGEGFVYLQSTVEEIVGEPLGPWLQKHLLAPLKMDSSSYTWTEAMEDIGASGHEDGEPTGRRKFRRPNTAYSLLTTGEDLAKVLCFMIQPPAKSRFLPGPESVEMMLEPGPIDPRRNVSRGLGWMVQDRPQAFGHTGSNGGGHRAVAMASRQTGAGIVVLTNSRGGKKLYRKLIQSVTGTQKMLPS